MPEPTKVACTSRRTLPKENAMFAPVAARFVNELKKPRAACPRRSAPFASNELMELDSDSEVLNMIADYAQLRQQLEYCY